MIHFVIPFGEEPPNGTEFKTTPRPQIRGSVPPQKRGVSERRVADIIQVIRLEEHLADALVLVHFQPFLETLANFHLFRSFPLKSCLNEVPGPHPHAVAQSRDPRADISSALA